MGSSSRQSCKKCHKQRFSMAMLDLHHSQSLYVLKTKENILRCYCAFTVTKCFGSRSCCGVTKCFRCRSCCGVDIMHSISLTTTTRNFSEIIWISCHLLGGAGVLCAKLMYPSSWVRFRPARECGFSWAVEIDWYGVLQSRRFVAR